MAYGYFIMGTPRKYYRYTRVAKHDRQRARKEVRQLKHQGKVQRRLQSKRARQDAVEEYYDSRSS